MEMMKNALSLEEQVANLLKEKNLKITCAESCTGGLISGRLVNVSGISDFYEAGIVTYANAAKERFLKVPGDMLEKYGAVSSQVAEAMARGAISFAGADVSIAVTGIAGPGGGTPEKPVGLVYMACCVRDEVTVRKHNFTGDRQSVRECTVQEALKLVIECLSK
ncbi:MAG: CinA family protein [Lachnospiraceae bacterium]|nr:CinA family protein [Lachnospiraceae bacterium]